jgi:hypothetical protein
MARVLLRNSDGVLGFRYNFEDNDRVVPRAAPRIRDLVNEMVETELRRIETHPGFIRITTNHNMEQSIRGYTGNMYDNINDFNRGVNGNRVFERDPEGNFRYPYARPHVGYYSQKIKSAFDLVPPTQRDLIVFRGISYDNSRYNALNGTPYSEIYDKSYMSTTTKATTSDHFFNNNRPQDEQGLRCCYMIINIPKGSRVLPLRTISVFDTEEEILLQNSSHLKYLNTHILKDRHNNLAVLHEYKLVNDDDADDELFNDPVEVEGYPYPSIEQLEDAIDDLNFQDVDEFEDVIEQIGGRSEKGGLKVHSLFENKSIDDINKKQIDDIREFSKEFSNKNPKKDFTNTHYSKSVSRYNRENLMSNLYSNRAF